MDTQKGSVSINTENIFPIIKKWLYSEKDIFIREILSNAGDAISKLKKLISVGEAEVPEGSTDWKIEVLLDEDNKTVTVHDNGIGMTQEEVVKYINQIAFSGAKDFLEKYEGKTDGEQIIGHFGLGFYSSFMVSDKVEIDTLSWAPGSKAVHWESEDGMNFSMGDSELDERGTYVTMHLSEDGKEFLNEYTLREILEKYFSFFPIEIYFVNVKKEAEKEKEKEKKAKKERKKKPKETVTKEDAAEDAGSKPEAETAEAADEKPEETEDAEKEDEQPKPINETAPLWLKNARDCTEDEYKEFYRKTFHDYNDPLFWIHLNVDYPFNLKGILYFPKLKDRYESLEGQIKVYYNQVFVADNIKEILPEFLMLLKGVIDCPDLPLNVSRSFLQNDGYVNKISAHITKKVADKLNGLFNTERENYCKYWDDINPFVKFGCLKDEKLYDKIKDSLLFKTTDGEYLTLSEYLEKYKEKTDGKTVYYSDDTVLQSQYIRMLGSSGIGIAVLDGPIDVPYMQFLEYKHGDGLKFARIDSDVAESMKAETDADKETLDGLTGQLEGDFRRIAGNEKLTVRTEALQSSMPAILLLSEQGRRMQEMAKQFGGSFGIPTDDELTLVLNYNNPVIKGLSAMKQAEDSRFDMIASQVYDIALLAHKPMDADALTKFIERSAQLLAEVAGNGSEKA